MKIKFLLLAMFAIAAVLMACFYSVFTIPKQPQLISINQEASRSDWYCREVKQARPAIDDNGRLNVLVWNIHKQNAPDWQEALKEYSHQRQLILLQEASLTADFTQWLQQQSWGASYVNAFKVFDTSSGVVNLSPQLPIKACAYTSVEPWFLLPKSALYARYALSNGEELVVINIHAINFTVGTVEFKHQIQQLQQAVNEHDGPLIVAGDFNTWSSERLTQLRNITQALNMKETNFTPDHRRLFINDLAFDHVFYRNLKLISASAPNTTASDHNPMLVSFELELTH